MFRLPILHSLIVLPALLLLLPLLPFQPPNSPPVATTLNFTWNAARALTQVADAGSGSTLLTLTYGTNGKLATATDIYGRQVAYTFTTATANSQNFLETVSKLSLQVLRILLRVGRMPTPLKKDNS